MRPRRRSSPCGAASCPRAGCSASPSKAWGDGTLTITAFVVPVEADARFLAAWRDTAATLHRALRDDVDFRFVAVGGGEPGGDFPSHSAPYEVVHEEGAPGEPG